MAMVVQPSLFNTTVLFVILILHYIWKNTSPPDNEVLFFTHAGGRYDNALVFSVFICIVWGAIRKDRNNVAMYYNIRNGHQADEVVCSLPMQLVDIRRK